MKKTQESKKQKITFETKPLKNTSVDHNNSAVVTFIIALIVIAVLVGGLYFVNAKYVTKDKYQDETTTTTTEPSYDATIILGDDALSQKDKEYMVLYYDKSDKIGASYASLASSYKGDTPLYSVDLSNKMNANYYSKDGMNDKLPSSLNDLKVTSPALLTVKKGKITALTGDATEIYSKLSGTNLK